MNFEILKAELALAKYSAMTDAEVAIDINNTLSTEYHPAQINYKTILARCDGAGELLDALEAAAIVAPDVKWALLGIKSQEGIDLGNVKTRLQVDALETATLLTAAQAASLKGLTTLKTISEKLGIGFVQESHITKARFNS